MKKRIQAIALLIISVFVLNSCYGGEFNNEDIDDVLDMGYNSFVGDREESYPDMRTADERLQELVDKFGGGYSSPEFVEIVDPDPDDTTSPADEDDKGNSQKDDIPKSISSHQELVSAIAVMVNNVCTEMVTFKLTSGYTLSEGELMDAALEAAVDSFLYHGYIESYSYNTNIPKKIMLQINFNKSRADIINQTKKAVSRAKKIEKELGLASMSDFEKIETVNDYLCETCIYDPDYYTKKDNSNDHTAYGALCEGVCVCDGYARSVCLLLGDVNVETQIVIGDAGGGHAWNIVKLDGNWYQLDTTWNDNSIDGKTSSDEYFLIDDAQLISESRTWDFDFYPKCDSGKYKK